PAHHAALPVSLSADQAPPPLSFPTSFSPPPQPPSSTLFPYTTLFRSNLASKSFGIHQEVIPSDVRMACQTLSLLALSITTFSICGILLLLFIYDTSVFDVTPFSVIFSIVILFKYIILLSKTILFPYYYSIYKK